MASSRVGIRWGRVALSLLLLLVARGSSRAQAEPPHIVWLVIDCLRWDRVGAYKPENGHLTPFLDTIAQQSHVYWRAYASSSWTMPSVGSMFTSHYPSELGVASFRSRLDESETTLAETLLAHGYLTAGFSANFLVGQGNGFSQGFEHWYNAPLASASIFDKPRAAVLLENLRAFLASRETALVERRPLFLFFHIMEPHFPYAPPQFELEQVLLRKPEAATIQEAISALFFADDRQQRWKVPSPRERDAIVALYDAEVLAADRAAAQILGELRERRLLENALLIVTADHGEDLFDADTQGHGLHLREVTIRVPLLVSFPQQTGRVDVHRVVSQLDLAPTVLTAAGISVPSSMAGRPLERLETLRARLWAKLFPGPNWALSELPPGLPDGKERPSPQERSAWIEGSWKLIEQEDGRKTLWRVNNQTLAEQPANDPARLRQLMTERDRRSIRRGRAAAPTVSLDEATKEHLRALGYAE